MADGLLDNIGAVTQGTPTTVSTEAQDVAKAQGVTFSELAKSQEERDATASTAQYDATQAAQGLEELGGYKPGESYMDQAKGTVAGQLSTLLASDSPYIKQQEEKAKEYAAGRGLINSTLAAGAGREAAISAATPIASADAAAYNQFKGAEQQAEYNLKTIQAEAIVSGEMIEQRAEIDRRNQDINNSFQAQLAGANAESQVWLTDLQNTYNVSIQNLDAINRKMLLDTELTANQVRDVTQASTDIMKNYQISVENMMTDPDLLALGPAAVNNAVNQLQTLAGNSIKFIGASQGIPMDTFVNHYLSPLTVLR